MPNQMGAADWILVAAAGLIVLATAAFGYRDIVRLRMRRVLALAGVSFRESLRRRVLWITPLAILGVIAVSQFTKAVDEQDAIRQTTKYAIFASALLVMMAVIVLAATNLPREIENRVIYTIVTKPTTRLEIVLGKVIGFAGVSAAILLIMGLFTWGYLHLRSQLLMSDVRAALESGRYEKSSEETLRHYARSGLLETRELAWPASLEVYSRPPVDPNVRWTRGGEGQFFMVYFSLPKSEIEKIVSTVLTQWPASQAQPALQSEDKLVELMQEAVRVRVTMPVAHQVLTPEEVAELADLPREAGGTTAIGPALPSTQPTTNPAELPPLIPQLNVGFTTWEGQPLGQQQEQSQSVAATPLDSPPTVGKPAIRTFHSKLPLAAVRHFFSADDKGRYRVAIEVSPATPTLEYGVTPYSVELYVSAFNKPLDAVMNFVPNDRDGDGKPEMPKVQSRLGRFGMQIAGKPEGSSSEASLAVYRFAKTPVPDAIDGLVPLQMNVAVERAGDLLDSGQNTLSRASVEVRNLKSGEVSQPEFFVPETSRLSYVYVPAKYFDGGDFEVFVRGRTEGQWLGMRSPEAKTPSVALVTNNSHFALNLFKSLFILWLMSLLAVTIAVFCSTFLSWPIAIMLTLLILFGGWGVQQLGDALAPGSERNVAGDIFKVRDPAKAEAITTFMGGLSASLRAMAQVLPNVSHFPVIEDIERGVSISGSKVWSASTTAFGYGIPLMLLTYLVLRKKEVAP